MLLTWQVRELLEIFPLRISALRSQSGPPLKVTICNLKVPEGGPASSSSWGEAEVSSWGLCGWQLLARLARAGHLMTSGNLPGSVSGQIGLPC
jgi:hypothetical protein